MSAVPLGPESLALDCEAELQRIVQWIPQVLTQKLRRRGLVVAISGGIDSSVVTCLATRALGPDRVQVLFMTVDPERDTQQLLAQYVPAFDPRFIGLYADLPTTAAVARDYKVFYQKQGDVAGKAYTVDHSTGTYVYDPQGRLRLYVKHGEKPEGIAADLKRLLAGK
mgnify:CR=1 FL=1